MCGNSNLKDKIPCEIFYNAEIIQYQYPGIFFPLYPNTNKIYSISSQHKATNLPAGKHLL